MSNNKSNNIDPRVLSKKIFGKDVVLNVTFKDAMIRFGVMVFLPIFVMLIDKNLVIYTAPILAYLFITALAKFCWVKYIWHHYFKHEITVAPAYGKDPNAPEESR